MKTFRERHPDITYNIEDYEVIETNGKWKAWKGLSPYISLNKFPKMYFSSKKELIADMKESDKISLLYNS